MIDYDRPKSQVDKPITLGEKLDKMYDLLKTSKEKYDDYVAFHTALCAEVAPLGLTLEYSYASERYFLISVSEL